MSDSTSPSASAPVADEWIKVKSKKNKKKNNLPTNEKSGEKAASSENKVNKKNNQKDKRKGSSAPAPESAAPASDSASDPSAPAPAPAAPVKSLADERKEEWTKEEERIKASLVLEDAFDWSLALPVDAKSGGADPASWANKLFKKTGSSAEPEKKDERKPLSIVAGIDISYIRGDIKRNQAMAGIVICSFPSMEVLYRKTITVNLREPFIPTYLAFREVKFLVDLIEEVKATKPEFVPQLIFVDGNGVFHYRGCGVASLLGVKVDIPTIGIAKKVLAVDGLSEMVTKKLSSDHLHKGGEAVELSGQSGTVHGALMRGKQGNRPFIISVGHRVSLETAVDICRASLKSKLPEPIHLVNKKTREDVAKYEAELIELKNNRRFERRNNNNNNRPRGPKEEGAAPGPDGQVNGKASPKPGPRNESGFAGRGGKGARGGKGPARGSPRPGPRAQGRGAGAPRSPKPQDHGAAPAAAAASPAEAKPAEQAAVAPAAGAAPAASSPSGKAAPAAGKRPAGGAPQYQKKQGQAPRPQQQYQQKVKQDNNNTNTKA